MSEESNFKVPLTRVLKVQNHPNADRLDLVTVYGFQVIAGRNSYRAGDLVYYVPIDSIIPNWLEEIVFKDSKVKPNNGRIRQIKLRGTASQGLLINPELIPDSCFKKKVQVEDDVSEALEIVKYEPPVKGPSHTIGAGKFRNRTYENKLFHKYNGLTHIKWVPTIFENEEIIVQEKLHGTNARAGIVPFEANNIWKKLLKLLHLAPKYEKCYGSNNVEISAKQKAYKGYYEEDFYGKTFKKIDIFSKLRPGEIVYGEIVGPGIQSNYDYGLTEPEFVVFDVKVLQPDGKYKWLPPDEVLCFSQMNKLKMVPELYRGMYDKELVYKLTFGPSVYNPIQKVREGIVIKSKDNYDIEGNKKAYKWVSETYLSDNSNTDNH